MTLGHRWTSTSAAMRAGGSTVTYSYLPGKVVVTSSAIASNADAKSSLPTQHRSDRSSSGGLAADRDLPIQSGSARRHQTFVEVVATQQFSQAYSDAATEGWRPRAASAKRSCQAGRGVSAKSQELTIPIRDPKDPHALFRVNVSRRRKRLTGESICWPSDSNNSRSRAAGRLKLPSTWNK